MILSLDSSGERRYSSGKLSCPSIIISPQNDFDLTIVRIASII